MYCCEKEQHIINRYHKDRIGGASVLLNLIAQPSVDGFMRML